MDERQLVHYPRSGTSLLRGSVCCVLLTFSPFKYPLKSPSHDQNLRCCGSLKEPTHFL